MQSNILVNNMKKMLLITMIATTLTAMATCLVFEKEMCKVHKTSDSIGNIDGKTINTKCDKNSCKRSLIK